MSAFYPAPIQSDAMIADMVDVLGAYRSDIWTHPFLRGCLGGCAPALIWAYHVHHVRCFPSSYFANTCKRTWSETAPCPGMSTMSALVANQSGPCNCGSCDGSFALFSLLPAALARLTSRTQGLRHILRESLMATGLRNTEGYCPAPGKESILESWRSRCWRLPLFFRAPIPQVKRNPLSELRLLFV